MDRGSFLFGLWSLLIVGGFLGASAYGYSPFADGGRVAPRAGYYGPTHK
jgi:hypothetical protein